MCSKTNAQLKDYACDPAQMPILIKNFLFHHVRYKWAKTQKLTWLWVESDISVKSVDVGKTAITYFSALSS